MPPAGPATPKDAAAVARFEGLAARRARVHQRRARDARPGHGVGGRGADGRGALRGPLRPRPRLALAAHVLQRHHRRRLRGAGGERARGARRRRRGDDVRAAGRPRRRSTTTWSRPRCAACRRCSPRCRSASQVGTFVHRVFEATDFAAPDLDAELGEHVAATLARRSVDVGDPATTMAGLRAAIETPLGPLLGGRALRDIERADRLDELDLRAAARRRRPAHRAPDPRRHRGRAARPPPRATTRSPATPSASTTPTCARACAATSPAASTSSCAPTTASPSSTTRRTGSARPARS